MMQGSGHQYQETKQDGGRYSASEGQLKNASDEFLANLFLNFIFLARWSDCI